jgi:flagellar biosynthesis protein FlhG
MTTYAPTYPLAPARPVAAGLDDQATRLRAIIESQRARGPAEAAPAATVGRRARVISVSSGKGGVGKTNLCVNLAIALAGAGKRVTLLDADLGLANADVLCGITPTKRLERFVGVADGAAVGSRSALAELTVEAPGGFRLVPGSAGVARMAELSEHERARLLAGVAELERDADLLIIDTAAGLGHSVLELMQVADLSIVVVTPEPTSIADAYAVIKCAAAQSPGPEGRRARLALVVNQARDRAEAQAVHRRISGVASRFLGFEVPLLGRVALDPRVTLAVRRRTPVLIDAPRAECSRDIRALAAGLVAALAPEVPARGLRESRRSTLSEALSKLVLRTK